MGSQYHGIPKELALRLKQKYGLQVFIETGTYKGNSTSWAGREFFRVHTIDRHRDFLVEAQHRCLLQPVVFWHGRSEVVLPKLLQQIDMPVLFWLDAHWSRDLGYNQPDVVCPVLAEIEAINSFNYPHVVLIDDARLFGSTEGWPTSEMVLEQLRANGRRHCFVEGDVIVGVPRNGQTSHTG